MLAGPRVAMPSRVSPGARPARGETLPLRPAAETWRDAVAFACLSPALLPHRKGRSASPGPVGPASQSAQHRPLLAAPPRVPRAARLLPAACFLETTRGAFASGVAGNTTSAA
jgi:hypothetical protein